MNAAVLACGAVLSTGCAVSSGQSSVGQYVDDATIAVPMLIGIRSLCRSRQSLRQVWPYLDGRWRPPPSLAALLRVRRSPVGGVQEPPGA